MSWSQAAAFGAAITASAAALVAVSAFFRDRAKLLVRFVPRLDDTGPQLHIQVINEGRQPIMVVLLAMISDATFRGGNWLYRPRLGRLKMMAWLLAVRLPQRRENEPGRRLESLPILSKLKLLAIPAEGPQGGEGFPEETKELPALLKPGDMVSLMCELKSVDATWLAESKNVRVITLDARNRVAASGLWAPTGFHWYRLFATYGLEQWRQGLKGYARRRAVFPADAKTKAVWDRVWSEPRDPSSDGGSAGSDVEAPSQESGRPTVPGADES